MLPNATFLVRSGEEFTINLRLNTEADIARVVQQESTDGVNQKSGQHPEEGAPTLPTDAALPVLAILVGYHHPAGGNVNQTRKWESPHRVLALHADTRVLGFADLEQQGQSICTASQHTLASITVSGEMIQGSRS